MPDPTAAQVKEGIQTLTLNPKFNAEYKTINTATGFNKLHTALNTWLEGKGTDNAKADLVKSVIKQDFQAKFFLGKPPSIGGTDLGMVKAVTPTVALGPKYTDLTATWKATDSEYPKVRQDVARVLNLLDKGHSAHGANFSGTQSLEQIIKNLVEKVEGKTEVPRIQHAVKLHYKLDLS